MKITLLTFIGFTPDLFAQTNFVQFYLLKFLCLSMATAPAHTVRAPEGKDSAALCAHLPSADTHCTLVLCYFNPIIYRELYSSCQKYTFLFLFFLTNKVTAFPFLLTVKTGENDFCTFTFLQIYNVLIFTFLQLYHLHLLKGPAIFL